MRHSLHHVALGVVALLALPALRPAALLAQATPDSTTAAADSLAQRMAEAERAIALLREQLAAMEAGATQSASRARLELSGRVLMNAWSNSARVNNADVPLFVRESPAGVPSARAVGASIRQSTLAAAVTSLRALGGAFDGDLAVDFFGGQQPSSGGRHFPLVRMRTARATIAWSHAELLAGQESPLVADVDPVSLASVGVPGFTAAGNLWLWFPQLRGTVETSPWRGGLRMALQGAVLAATTGDPVGDFDTEPDAAERARRPALQARVRARWGADDRAGEAGVGVHRSWLVAADGGRIPSRAVTATLRAGLLSWLEVRGEAFDGQALRGLGGGGISQLVSGTGPVRTRGGWGQLNLRRGDALVVGGGCGIDDPEDADLPNVGRFRNRSCEGHVVARPGGPLLLGAEFRRTTTDYAAGGVRNDHVNVAIGFEF